MILDQLKPNKILRGPLFAEPVEVIVTVPMGAAVKLVGRGVQTGMVVAMLQRRFASSIYAVRRSLERMRDKRGRVLADPKGFHQGQINRRLP